MWPTKGSAILHRMDGMARKQLEKANPHESEAIAAPVSTKPPVNKRPSAMSAIIAEKRKAKAAELSAGTSPRHVSGPEPSSPSIQQAVPRSSSSSSIPSTQRANNLTRSVNTPESPPRLRASSPQKTPRAPSKSPLVSPEAYLQRSRSSSLNRAQSSSPPLSTGSSRGTPLRQANMLPAGVRSPTSSSATSGIPTLKTPTLVRKPLPSFSGQVNSIPLSLTFAANTPGPIVPDALRAQAAQAESAARQLLDFDDPGIQSAPLTPERQDLKPGYSNGNGFLHTPANHHSTVRRIWDDSPAPGAITPNMLENLKGRKSERKWWLRQQQCARAVKIDDLEVQADAFLVIEQTTPLKPTTSTVSSAISLDVEALQGGSPEIRNLQKLSMFSSAHAIPLPAAHSADHGDDDKDEIADEREIWDADRLFERIFEGLMAFLDPAKVSFTCLPDQRGAEGTAPKGAHPGYGPALGTGATSICPTRRSRDVTCRRPFPTPRMQLA